MVPRSVPRRLVVPPLPISAKSLAKRDDLFTYFKNAFVCFLAVLGLHRCVSFSLAAESRGHASAVHTFLAVLASAVVECGLQGTWAQQL